MADFCKQCSIEMFGEDYGDLALGPLPSKEHGWAVLCEGCGPTHVDSEGVCVQPMCLRAHGGDNVKNVEVGA